MPLPLTHLHRNLASKMIFPLSLMLLLFLGTVGGVYYRLQARTADSVVINEAGRLRMLSQKLAKASAVYGRGDAEARDEMEATAEAFRTTLNSVHRGAPDRDIPPAPPEIAAQYEIITDIWTPIDAAIRTLSEVEPESEAFYAALDVVEENNLELLAELNEAVQLFEAEANDGAVALAGSLSTALLLNLLAFGALIWLIRRTVRPLREVRDAAHRVAAGAKDVTVPVESADEIGELAGTFNVMVQQVERRARSIRSVIDAAITVSTAEDLELGLGAMLTAAKESVEAKYAAVSVFDASGAVETFLTLGMSEAEQAGISQAPRGAGLLGHIHTHGETLRLDDMTRHPASVGFPDGHPPMKALLATPVVHNGESLGNLYLADKTTGDGTFDAEDEAFLERIAALCAASIAGKKAADEKGRQQAYLERQVERAVTEMEAFADGDLTVRIDPERDDAIARLFHAFNRAADTLSAMVARIAAAAEETSSATVQIGASTEQLAAGAHEQSAQAEEVAAAVEEMVRTIVDTSQNATHTAGAATRNGEIAEEGAAVVIETVTKIREAADVVGQSAETVERLGASSQQIGEIVATIEDIADQTNLLALNAAIEAARAGEHGRGFAVVADEVRKLAERTATATAEISGMIGAIQSETAEAVAAMRSGRSEVEAGIALADRAGDSLRQIVAGAEETRAMVGSIAAASEQQSTTSEEMARSVEAISSVSAEAARGIGQIATAVGGLSELTDELRTLVGQFRTDGAAWDAATRGTGGDGHARMPTPPRLTGGCPFPHA
jgi:methyl-accepting chemotaxis protein